jgi:thiol-disulfide isomerase/thioredoxin
MKALVFVLLSLSILLISCKNEVSTAGNKKHNPIKTGTWRAALKIDNGQAETEIAFQINFFSESGVYRAEILNANERIPVHEISIRNDSVFIMLPVFDSEIKARIQTDTLIGNWFNYVKGDYFIPFVACFGDSTRYHPKSEQANSADVSGRWHAEFSPGKDESSKAIGEFKQNGNIVSGTFLTETGDYRYLEGINDGSKLLLSCFDGSHAFLFTASIKDDSLCEGVFYSGKHWKEEWKAYRDDSFDLQDPYTLTFLNEGYSKFEIEMPDVNGNTVSLPGNRFRDKVVIVQIMGTWCPNCIDETFFLCDVQNKYKEDGLEIIAIAFEATEDTVQIIRNIERLKDRTGARYDFLIGGKAGKTNASAKLPMLNHIMSYPTTIIIDRNETVRKIHTGFTGPGTGNHYEEFVREFETTLEKILMER